MLICSRYQKHCVQFHFVEITLKRVQKLIPILSPSITDICLFKAHRNLRQNHHPCCFARLLCNCLSEVRKTRVGLVGVLVGGTYGVRAGWCIVSETAYTRKWCYKCEWNRPYKNAWNLKRACTQNVNICTCMQWSKWHRHFQQLSECVFSV